MSLIPMTHAPETGAINRVHFLTPVFGAGFWHHERLETGMKISGAENKQGRKRRIINTKITKFST